MRIAIVNQYYPPDVAPTAQLAASLAEHRAVLGDDVTVFTSSASYTDGTTTHNVEAAQGERMRVIRISSSSRPAVSISARVLQYLRFYAGLCWRLAALPRQDAVIALTTPPYIALLCSLRKFIKRDGRLILWNMDCYPDVLEATRLISTGGLLARCLKFATRRMIQQVDCVVCLDEAMKRLIERSYGGAGEALVVIPNWESLAAFSSADDIPPWPGVETLRLAGKFVILYFGNAGYGHEFQTVLDAAELLRDDPVVFLFVGGGAKHKWLQDEAQRRSLSKVIFHGHVPKHQTRAVLAAGDLSLITLADAALGMMCPSKLHSSLAVGLPVLYVGPAGGNVDAAIERFQCGASVRHGDAASLVEFVRRTSRDQDWMQALRGRSRRAFEEAYCDAVNLPLFDQIIDHCYSTKCPAKTSQAPVSVAESPLS